MWAEPHRRYGAAQAVGCGEVGEGDGEVVGEQPDLPGAHSVRGEGFRDAVGVEPVGRRPGQPAYRVRGDQVLRRELVRRGDADHHLAAAGQPGGRDGVALSPPMGRWWPVGSGRLRQGGVGQRARLGKGVEPHGDEPADGPAAEPGQAEQRPLVVGVGVGRRDDRGVGQHAPGCAVAAPGHDVARLPQRPHARQWRATRGPCGCRRCAATDRAGP